MIKRLELVEPNSCLNKAHPEEMLFVLLARDPAAPAAIRAWVEERIRIGQNMRSDQKIKDALQCADEMERR